MESIEAIIQQQQLAGKLFGGFFGLEVEQHRVLTNGKLSRHPYPAAFSSRRHNPYLKTDFCDNMFELVAPPRSRGHGGGPKPQVLATNCQ